MKLAFCRDGDDLHAAIQDHDGTVVEKITPVGSDYAVTLPKVLNELWEGRSPLTSIATPSGPESFTSLRIGLAMAQGIASAFPKASTYAPTWFNLVSSVLTHDALIVLHGNMAARWFRGELLFLDTPFNDDQQPLPIVSPPHLNALAYWPTISWAKILLQWPIPSLFRPFYSGTPTYAKRITPTYT